MQIFLWVIVIASSMLFGIFAVLLILYFFRSKVEAAVIKGDHAQPPIMLTLPLVGKLKKHIPTTFVFDSQSRYSQMRKRDVRFVSELEATKDKPPVARLQDGTMQSTENMGWTVVLVKMGNHTFGLHCLVVPDNHQNCLGCYPLLTKYDVTISSLKLEISKADSLSLFLRGLRWLARRN